MHGHRDEAKEGVQYHGAPHGGELDGLPYLVDLSADGGVPVGNDLDLGGVAAQRELVPLRGAIHALLRIVMRLRPLPAGGAMGNYHFGFGLEAH